MNFSQAIESGFKNYVNFSGRAARSEYWFWTLFAFLGGIVTMFADSSLFGTAGGGNGPISLVFTLAMLLPNLAMGFRRLHDLDKSAWWWLIVLIPLVGVIILIVFACRKGTDGPNRFGPDPLMLPAL